MVGKLSPGFERVDSPLDCLEEAMNLAGGPLDSSPYVDGDTLDNSQTQRDGNDQNDDKTYTGQSPLAGKVNLTPEPSNRTTTDRVLPPYLRPSPTAEQDTHLLYRPSQPWDFLNIPGPSMETGVSYDHLKSPPQPPVPLFRNSPPLLPQYLAPPPQVQSSNASLSNISARPEQPSGSLPMPQGYPWLHDQLGLFDQHMMEQAEQPTPLNASAQMELPNKDPIMGGLPIKASQVSYTCPVCKKILKTKGEMNKHICRHTKPFTCSVEDCPRRQNGFSTANDLARHQKNAHSIPNVRGVSYRCFLGPCENKPTIWPRMDNFRSHLARVHQRRDEDLTPFIYQKNSAFSNEDSAPTINKSATEAESTKPFTLEGPNDMGPLLASQEPRSALQDIPILEFITPFDIWCLNCRLPTIIYQGTRFGTPKSVVSFENNQRINKFYFLHELCGGLIVIQSDQVGHATVIEGGRRFKDPPLPIEFDSDSQEKNAAELYQIEAWMERMNYDAIDDLPGIRLFDNYAKTGSPAKELTWWSDKKHQEQPSSTVLPRPRQPLYATSIGPAKTIWTDSGYVSVDKQISESKRLQQRDEPDVFEQRADDSRTEYSKAETISPMTQRTYIQWFANDVLERLESGYAEQLNAVVVSAKAAELLKALALQIGSMGSTQSHLDVMYFIHKNRMEIVNYLGEIAAEQQEKQAKSPKMSLDDIMDLWSENQHIDATESPIDQVTSPLDDVMDLWSKTQHVDTTESPVDQATPPLNEQHIDVLEEPSMNDAYKMTVTDSPAYEWFLSRLGRECRMTAGKHDKMTLMGKAVIESLTSSVTISRKERPKVFKVQFSLDWDTSSLSLGYGAGLTMRQIVEDSITLTGHVDESQALTCLQYMSQVWPGTGERTLQLLHEILSDSTGRAKYCKWPDGTYLLGSNQHSRVAIRAIGIASSLAEVAEQLGWIGAALRQSAMPYGLSICSPLIRSINRGKLFSKSSHLEPQATYEIDFQLTEIEPTVSLPNGQCWQSMFRNPILVQGYPIPLRENSQTGIEISLYTMMALIGTDRIDRFDDRLVLKGFSAMLIPTRRHRDILFWHFIFDSRGRRISYLDGGMSLEIEDDIEIENMRHIVGWCTESRFYAGSLQASHPVGASRLPSAHKLSGLSSTHVSPGRKPLATPPILLSMKDKPSYITRGYIPSLKWLHKRFILLFDEEHKRGWLVNGTSALLHLVFASLRHDSEDRFKAAFEFDFRNVRESPTPLNADSAIDVLLNPQNTSLKIYPEGTGYITMKDRIEYFCNILEKLIDLQVRLGRDRSLNSNQYPRRYLAGWDFRDLATQEDPVSARVATLHSCGKGWVDFIRSINAVALIGREFGEIIKPNEEMCEQWGALPVQKYYIAASQYDLKELVENYSGKDTKLTKVSSNILLFDPNDTTVQCKCRGALSRQHTDPIQVLLPATLSGILIPRTGGSRLEGSGAVVFGQSPLFNWIWKDFGDPRERGADTKFDSEASEDELEESYPDAGSSASTSSRIGVSRSSSSLQKSIFSNPKNLSEPTISTVGTSFEADLAARKQYCVAILCALPKELLAIRASFDKTHEAVAVAAQDDNYYEFGEIGRHHVVACCLPMGEVGTSAAASSASHMKTSFPAIRCCLLVGIGGGVPCDDHDIRLGDVVVSAPRGAFPGIVQYDLGKALAGSRFESTGSLQRTPRFMMTTISSLMSNPNLGPEPLGLFLEEIRRKNLAYGHPGNKKRKHDRKGKCQALDQLFLPISCKKCPPAECLHRRAKPVERERRSSDHPVIHYGLIASGNQVIKDGKTRDMLAQRYGGVLCFEMEAAGVMNIFPCLVIRGICDYADANKNDLWQEYAAATAAAYAKLYLTSLKLEM